MDGECEFRRHTTNGNHRPNRRSEDRMWRSSKLKNIGGGILSRSFESRCPRSSRRFLGALARFAHLASARLRPRAAFLLGLIAGQASAAITFVQRNFATPQSPQSSVSVTYTAAQTAGNLNVVAVGWNDSTAVVNSVTDSKGNVYTRAVGPTAVAGQLSQSIYYAKNIAAASGQREHRDGAIQRCGAIRRYSHSRVQRH